MKTIVAALAICLVAGVLRSEEAKMKRMTEHADLSGSEFKDVNLTGTSFNDVNLAGATFKDINLAGAAFENVNLSKVKLHDINLSDLDLSAAQIGGAKFKHIGLPPDKTGKQAKQRPVTFEEMTLNDSTFSHVDLSNVKITDCEVKGMTIDGVLVTDLIAVYKAAKK